jgi:hypothetical protein
MSDIETITSWIAHWQRILDGSLSDDQRAYAEAQIRAWREALIRARCPGVRFGLEQVAA